MDFLFFFEHENREFESLVLMKRILERRGYSVEISSVSAWGYGWHMLFSVPQVVIVPWFRYDENVYKYTRFFRKKIGKIVNLQIEQIYNAHGEETNIVVTQGLAKQAYHLCWGKNSKERMRSWGISEDHTYICGAVHLDFFNAAFAGYSKNKHQLSVEFCLDGSKQWRLFISSFSFANYSKDGLQYLNENFGDFSSFVEISIRSKTAVLDWYEKVLPFQKDTIFIYRPHPSETTDDRLRKMETKYDNFKVIGAYSIRHWINACNTIDTWYSTSIGEVYAAGKSCNILRPEIIPEFLEVEIMRTARFINTYLEFLDTFDSARVSREEFPIQKQEIERYYEPCMHCLSAERVCNYLETVLQDQRFSTDFFSGLIGDKHKYNRMIITSLIGGLIGFLNMRLSTLIPMRKDVLRNLEKVNIGRRNRLREIEKGLIPYIDAYIDNKCNIPPDNAK